MPSQPSVGFQGKNQHSAKMKMTRILGFLAKKNGCLFLAGCVIFLVVASFQDLSFQDWYGL